jgi:azurin
MKYLSIAALLFLARAAAADVCPLTIDATDDMRFEQDSLQVETRCTDVEVTLHHTGKLPAHVMGHDWVLTKTSDVAAVANAGMGAGLANSFQQPGDKRIIAATKIVGGGEKAVVTFNTSQLERGVSYSYFCSAPGHFSMMKGRLVYNAASSSSVARNVEAGEPAKP